MTNIITIKWGTKYSSDYANKIFLSCKEKCSFDFTFYCVTDDQEGLDPGIVALPMPTHSNLNYYSYINEHLENKTLMWDRPKLYLFTDFEQYFEGTNIFLDLDAQVNEDLYYLTTLPSDKPWIIDMYWKLNWKENWDKLWNGRINSSIIVWRDNQCKEITERVLDNAQENFSKYATIDTFMGYEVVDYKDYNNTFFNFLPAFVCCLGKRHTPAPSEFLITLWSNSPGARHGGVPKVPGV